MRVDKHLVLAALAFATIMGAKGSGLPAPLPKFEKTFKVNSSKINQIDKSYFYTGKPYLSESQSYLFQFRRLDSEAGRWTVSDPSGFPDGANNRIYAPIPTSQLDPYGLRILIKVNDFSALETDWMESEFYVPYGFDENEISDRSKDRYRIVFQSWAADSNLPTMVGYADEDLDVDYSANASTSTTNTIQFALQGDFKFVKATVAGSRAWTSGSGNSFTGHGHQDANPGFTITADFVVATYAVEVETQLYARQEDGSYSPYPYGWQDKSSKTFLGAIGAAFYE